MGGRGTRTVEGLAGFEAHGHFLGAAEIDNLLKALAARAFGDQDAVEGTPGFESFMDRMDSRENSH